MRHSKLKTLVPEIEIERHLPVNLSAQDLSLFQHDIRKKLPEVSLLKFSNVNVTPEGVVWKGFQVAKELLIYPKHQALYNWRYTLSNRVKRKKERLPPGDYFLCTDYWADGYFHWVCDALPRIFLVKEQLASGTLLIPEQYSAPYYMETLEAFRIGQIKRIPIDTYCHVERLITPEQPAVSGEHSPQVTCLLREQLLAHFRGFFSGKHNYPNVYISRNKAKYRKVLNEDQVIEVLEKFDFKILFFEDYSMKEQVEIAYNARNLVSLHGANLTNVLYMQPGGNVLEFRKNNDPHNNYYYSLADSVACRYYYMNCEYVDRKTGNFFDVIVDLTKFEKIVAAMLQKRD
jgi:capsular polysaccharide biosynthesis protein